VDATSHHGTHLQRAGAEFPEQLARNTPYPLSSGDVLTFGKTLGKDDQFFAPIAVRIQCTFGPDERALALPALSALLSRVSPAPAPARSWGRFGADGEAASSRASSSSGDSDIKEIPCPGAGAQSRSSSSSASTSSSPGLALVPLDDDAAGPSAGPRPVACARLPSIDGLLRHISWPALLPPLRHSAAHARSTAAGLLFFPRALSPALALEPPVGPDAVQAQSADMDVDMDISEDMGVDADAPREVGLSRIDAILNTIEAEMAASAPSSAYMDAVRPGSPRPLPSFECGTCLQREAVVVENSPPHFAEEQQDEVVPAEDAVEGSVAVPKPDAESPIEALSVRLSKLEVFISSLWNDRVLMLTDCQSSLEVILSPQAAQQDEAALEAGPSVRPQALVDAVAALQQDVREMSSAANTVNERATSADTRAAQLERRIDTVEERMRDLVCADTLMEHGEVKPAVEALRALVAGKLIPMLCAARVSLTPLCRDVRDARQAPGGLCAQARRHAARGRALRG
jgi:hypothetical protein